MKKLLLIFIFLIPIIVWSQTTLQTVDFETDGAGYTANPSNFYNTPGISGNTGDYWARLKWDGTNWITGDGIVADMSSNIYSGWQGTWLFAGEDVDAVAPVTVTTDAVSISGYTNLQVKVLVGARDETLSSKEIDDYFKFESQIDGGGYTLIGQFLGDPSTDPNNDSFQEDVDLDGVFDPEGTKLIHTMQEFTFNVSGTGSTLQIRASLSNGAGEDVLFDNIRILGTEVPLPIELTYFKAINQDNNIALSWRTESETENLGFIIERRAKGTFPWERIASFRNEPELEGHGTTSETNNYQFIDMSTIAGLTYEYRLSDVDYNGKSTPHETLEISAPEEKTDLPTQFCLKEAYPNPFNPVTKISYDLAASSDVKIIVRDIKGRSIREWTYASQQAGSHTLMWNANEQASGVYIFQMIADGFTDSRKMVLLK